MTQEILLEEKEYYDLNNTRIRYIRDIQYNDSNDTFYLRNYYLKEFENNEKLLDEVQDLCVYENYIIEGCCKDETYLENLSNTKRVTVYENSMEIFDDKEIEWKNKNSKIEI